MEIIKDFIKDQEKLSAPSRENLETIVKDLIDKHKTNFKGVGQPLRIGLVGAKFGQVLPILYFHLISLR